MPNQPGSFIVTVNERNGGKTTQELLTGVQFQGNTTQSGNTVAGISENEIPRLLTALTLNFPVQGIENYNNKPDRAVRLALYQVEYSQSREPYLFCAGPPNNCTADQVLEIAEKQGVKDQLEMTKHPTSGSIRFHLKSANDLALLDKLVRPPTVPPPQKEINEFNANPNRLVDIIQVTPNAIGEAACSVEFVVRNGASLQYLKDVTGDRPWEYVSSDATGVLARVSNTALAKGLENLVYTETFDVQKDIDGCFAGSDYLIEKPTVIPYTSNTFRIEMKPVNGVPPELVTKILRDRNFPYDQNGAQIIAGPLLNTRLWIYHSTGARKQAAEFSANANAKATASVAFNNNGPVTTLTPKVNGDFGALKQAVEENRKAIAGSVTINDSSRTITIAGEETNLQPLLNQWQSEANVEAITKERERILGEALKKGEAILESHAKGSSDYGTVQTRAGDWTYETSWGSDYKGIFLVGSMWRIRLNEGNETSYVDARQVNHVTYSRFHSNQQKDINELIDEFAALNNSTEKAMAAVGR